MATFEIACILGIVSVYCVGMFPLVLASNIDWAREAVAIGAIIQVSASYLQAPIKSIAFVGAASCAVVIANPVVSYFLCSAAYGSFYATFLNQVESPDKVLKAEFMGELLFLPAAALCLFFAESLTVMILVVGLVWWIFSVDWIPEVLEPTKGTNSLFMVGWMCTSSIMSALLLSAIFIVSETYSSDDHPKVICIGLLLLMIGGCTASVACDTREWIDVMAIGLGLMTLVLCGVLVFEAGDWPLAVMAYALGSGMSATLVAVRKAYAGSYSTLLAMQKVAEVLPAVLIATVGECTTMYVHIGLCATAIAIFLVVRRREKANLQRLFFDTESSIIINSQTL